MNEGAKLRERLRTVGDWKSGSMFPVIFLKSGEPFIHGNDHTAESKNLLGVEGRNAEPRWSRSSSRLPPRGGGFVEYQGRRVEGRHTPSNTRRGSPRDDSCWSAATRRDVLACPDQDGGSAEARRHRIAGPWTARPLITFVEEAAKAYRSAVMSEGYSALTGVRNAFRAEGGDWKSGSIYLWVVSGGGIILFHGSETVSRRQTHKYGEDGHQRGEVRGGADRGGAARRPKVPSLSLRRPDSRGRRGHRLPEARLRGELFRCPTRTRGRSSAPAYISAWTTYDTWLRLHACARQGRERRTFAGSVSFGAAVQGMDLNRRLLDKV